MHLQTAANNKKRKMNRDEGGTIWKPNIRYESIPKLGDERS